MWTRRAHGLPPGRPLWLHGREARVPDPLEGCHDLPRHATAVAVPWPRAHTITVALPQLALPRSLSSLCLRL